MEPKPDSLDHLDPAQLKDLLKRASEAMAAYAQAIDSHLYRVSSYFANQETRIRELAWELETEAGKIELLVEEVMES